MRFCLILSKETGPMSEASMSRRLFLEGTVASGALLSLGSRVAGRGRCFG